MGKTTKKLYEVRPEVTRALLLAVQTKFAAADGWSVNTSLDELANLARAAGTMVVGRIIQKLRSPSPMFYLGKGKMAELLALREELDYGVVIVDDELAPRQQINLVDALDVKVIDRTALILDIFAQRARTREGRLQVELAQHQYLMPRLAGQWSHLERLGGGVGTRGPGEAQLETDRRIIRRKIERLQAEMESVSRHRSLYRQQRAQGGTPIVALVGYTNAGKSALLNSLTDAKVLVHNSLFSTLDPVTRKVRLPDGREFLLTDTVGFIHKLPPSVVSAFRATLEELREATLLLHVVDITHPYVGLQINTVLAILKELGLAEKPRITVLNKADLIRSSESELTQLEETSSEGLGLGRETVVAASALNGWGFQGLLAAIGQRLG